MLSITVGGQAPHELAPVPANSLKLSSSQSLPESLRAPRTIDELMRSRASTDPDLPLVSYPHRGLEYNDYTAWQLDQFAFHAAKAYSPALVPRCRSSETPAVVALLGPSNLDYLVTMLSVTKLGHTVLFLSPRISHQAFLHLLRVTKSTHLLFDSGMTSIAKNINKDLPKLQAQQIVSANTYDHLDKSIFDTCLTGILDVYQESSTIAWIIHSSGSTGLPKPIFQTQRAAINNYAKSMNMTGFVTLPLFHAHGIGMTFRAIYARKKILLYNAKLPLTKQTLIGIMKRYPFEVFYGVPYTLKLLAEDEEGIQLLTKCKTVMYGGSTCPDSLGDILVNAGVYLVSHWGSTETGQLMTSFRPVGDNAWAYMRPSEAVQAYLRMEEKGDGLYEAVCLDGWPSKVVSNRPDGSYAMKDLFTKHPTISNAWKYYGRLDDTITLVNGEKAMPLTIEGAAKQHPYIADAVAFGQGRDRVGIVLVKSIEAVKIPSDDIKCAVINSIAVQQAQESMPAYARITTDMMLVLDHDAEYPKTDKGTVIRLRFYKQFEKEIDRLYDAVSEEKGSLKLNENELRSFIRNTLQTILPNTNDMSDQDDFFNNGMDSLQAGRVRAAISREIDVGDTKLGMNIAFEHPSISKLAVFLYQARTGDITTICSNTTEEDMQALIDKYSDFNPSSYNKSPDSDFPSRTIVLTGVTGSLGAHMAAILAQDLSVTKIYCLVRASSDENAHSRMATSLQQRGVLEDIPSPCLTKLIALPSDLARPHLGLDAGVYHTLRSTVTSVIHSAWSVNFNLGLSSFEDCIRGARNLMQLSIVATCASCSFNFCSSVSTMMRHASISSTIPESVPPLTSAQSMGYAQSKLVTEHLCSIAGSKVPNMSTRVLRIGQIIGDSKRGAWNKQEAIPLILQTAQTIGALPALDENVRWLPVDTVAQCCVDISLQAKSNAQVYNILNAHSLHWTRELLPMLQTCNQNTPGSHRALPQFEIVDQLDWLARLRASNPDPALNPPVKLLDFFAAKYDKTVEERASHVEYTWETANAARSSEAFRMADAPGQGLMQRIMGYFVEQCW